MTTRTLAGALCAVTTIGACAVAGCGSSSSSSDAPSTTAAATPPATTTQAAAAATPASATTETTAAASSSSSSSAKTPLGSTLKLGQPAVVAYDDSTSKKKTTIKVTPAAIEKGSLGDFKNIKLDGDQKTSTPFYVKVTAENVGSVALPGKSSPATFVNGIDDRGQDQNEVIFFGDFPRCEAKLPKTFKPGESYTTCLTYLIPKGGSLKGMRWIAFDAKTGKSNIEWK